MERPTAHFHRKGRTVHVDVAKAILSAKLDLKDVLQIDLQGRPGTCVLTFRNFDARDGLVAAGLNLNGEQVSVMPGDGTRTACRVYVYGCEPHLHEGHIASRKAKGTSLSIFADFHKK